ncbi:MAG TPA: NAD+ synthase [Solirubrobacteraceae bacterium]|nr:NAD+ synthase [Solirubrobacteraceae bacterium]
MRLALCQMNATVGDIAGNAQRILAGLRAAREAGAELVLFPELALTGYPPEDLLLRAHFLEDSRSALRSLAAEADGTTAVVGFPETSDGHVYNAAAVLAGGGVSSIYRKVHLPNYGVFDEQRYFTAGSAGATIDLGGHPVGVTVCEDLWQPGPPATEEAAAGARLIVNISASPYHAGKGVERERLFARRARECGAHVAFCALVGGQDELLFDGHSFVLNPAGATIARACQFAEELLVCDLDLAPNADRSRSRPPLHTPIEPVEAEVYAALRLGLHDYVRKNGFSDVVLGLSGGIDSALVACLAVDALGAERVNVAIMPSPFSSAETQADAHALAAALGIRTHELPIAQVMDAYTQTLAGDFAGLQPGLTEENLQARIRGNLLMALSNKFGWLVLTTGNKSEMSVGYTTLYGDLAGGFAVIKDVPKTLVYRLCEWRNSPAGALPDPAAATPRDPSARGPAQARANAPIPASIIARAPSAELRPDQRDVDSLPPYELLDRILRGYIELDRSREQLIAAGLPEREVDRTIRLVDLAEYKRRQAPPGIKVTTRAFGRDRRMPITNRYRG